MFILPQLIPNMTTTIKSNLSRFRTTTLTLTCIYSTEVGLIAAEKANGFSCPGDNTSRIKARYYKQNDLIEIPFDFKTGLGLQGSR